MRIGILGLGNAGWTLHLPALARVRGVAAVGGCDLDAGRRRRAAERFGIPTFESLDAMLSGLQPEVVIVATPPVLHVEGCLAALAAGAHVICEKPFAVTVGDGRRILEAARVAGRRVALNHEFREMPIATAVLSAIGTNGVGALRFAHVWQAMDLPPWKEPGWRGDLSRGVLFEAGIHLVDYALALVREKPVSVWASMSTCGARDERTDAVALVTLEFPGGRVVQVTQNRLSPGDTRYFEVMVDCAHASLRASFGGRARVTAGMVRSPRPHVRVEYGASGLAWREVGPHRTVIARNPRDPGMVATRRLLAKTLAAFAHGTPAPVDGTTALEGLEVLAATYRSADTGARVPLDGATVAALAELRIGQG